MRRYIVQFETRKDRVLKTWQIGIEAANMKAAKKTAEESWYAKHTEHMFHVSVFRLEEEYPLEEFRVVDSYRYTWG